MGCTEGLGVEGKGMKGELTLAAAATACFWSASLQSPAKQQAISPRKLLFLQMHSTSRPQLPMPPWRKLLAHFCWIKGQERQC